MKLRILLTFLLGISVLFVTPTAALAVPIQNLNGATASTQTFLNDSNVTISTDTSTNIHSLIWLNQLPISRGGTGTNSFTNGSIPFIFNGIFSQDNSNFFWDNINKRLGIGTSSPTTSLDVSGNAKVTSLTSTNDSTINLITVGRGANSVNNNTALGLDALLGSTGGSNTAVGHRTLVNTGSYTDNTAVGAFVMSNNVGDGNTGMGSGAMLENVSGSSNTVIGTDAFRLNNSGNFNTVMGGQALRNNSNNGNRNVAVGFQAGTSSSAAPLTSPENSIYIGAEVRGFDDNDSNSIVIGYNAIGAGANTAVIGNSGLGHVYFGSSTGQAAIHSRKLFLGSSSVPGCIVMGDSDGNGVTYLTVNDGALTVSTTQPSSCID